MKNVSIKKRVRKNNNNKKYNKTQTKRSRRNKTQRNNRRRRNFRNKTRRGGAPHLPSPLRQGINADGTRSVSVVRSAHGTGAFKSKVPTNPVAKKAAANLGLSAPTSKRRGINLPPLDMESISSRKPYYNPAEIDIDEVEEGIIEEIERIKNKISPLVSDIEKLEEKNKELQGEINDKPYLEASAEEKSIINARVGQQVGENYSEIARRKSEIVSLESSIKNNEDAMKRLAKNIANIINTSKIHKKEYGENTPHGIMMKKMIKLGPGDKESWRFFLIKNFPGLAHYFYKHP